MITIDVLGCGPGIKNFKPIGNILFGVNDIFKYHKVDYLVLLDHPEAFNKERLEIIKNSKPFRTLSDLDSWAFMPGYKKFTKAETPGDVSTLTDSHKIPFHCDSTFTATALASCLICDNIVLWGVDFTNHPHLKEHSEIIKKCYKDLYKALIKIDIKLFVGYKESLLSDVLPIYKP